MEVKDVEGEKRRRKRRRRKEEEEVDATGVTSMLLEPQTQRGERVAKLRRKVSGRRLKAAPTERLGAAGLHGSDTRSSVTEPPPFGR